MDRKNTQRKCLCMTVLNLYNLTMVIGEWAGLIHSTAFQGYSANKKENPLQQYVNTNI